MLNRKRQDPPLLSQTPLFGLHTLPLSADSQQLLTEPEHFARPFVAAIDALGQIAEALLVFGQTVGILTEAPHHVLEALGLPVPGRGFTNPFYPVPT